MLLCRHQLLTSLKRNIIQKSFNISCNSSSSTAGVTSKGHMSKMDKLGVAFLGTICAGSFYLGIWQTQRYNWKVSMIEETKKKAASPAEIMPPLSQSGLSEYIIQMVGRRVSVTGTYDHGKEILIGPRSPPAGLLGPAAQGLAVNPQVICMCLFGSM